MVAEVARGRGHEVREGDLLRAGPALEPAVDAVRSFQPEVIGLSLRNIDNCDSCDLASYNDPYAELVRVLRHNTPAPIVLGGSGYSLFPEALLEQSGADYGVVGEGETVFCRLVDQLISGTRPEQRILHGDGALTGEMISAPTRDSELASFYLKEGGMLNLQTKRGCPHRCAYCTYPLLEGRTYRFRPPQTVVDEIEMLVTRYQAGYYAIADSVLNDQEGHYLEIAEELVRRDIRVPWMAFFRPQRFRREDVDLLRRAGLQAVEWGTDCATDATLEQMQKDFTWAEVEESNRLFAEAGLRNAHFIIFGGSGETEETVREGLANIKRLSDCVVFAFCGVRILPATAIHQRALAEKVVAPEDDLLQPRFYFSPDVTETLLGQALAQSFGTRPDRIYPPGRDTEKVRAFHRMGYRGPIWDLLLRKKDRRRRDVSA